MENKENNITTDKPLLTSTNLQMSTITFFSNTTSTKIDSNNESSTIKDKNNTIPIITSLIQNQNPTILNSINLYKQNITISYASDSNSSLGKSYQEYSNKTLNDIISSNTTNNQKSTKPFLPETVNIPLINKSLDRNVALFLGIIIPVFLIILVILICYCIKKRLRSKMSSISSDNINQKNLSNKSRIKQPYNRIQNTSGLNNMEVNPNVLSMNEIKVQNNNIDLHHNANNISSHSSGSSSSSRRRKREKKKSSNNNMIGEEGQKGMQNEIKEQIKQIVIDEHNNND
jgi:hypothetical protein